LGINVAVIGLGKMGILHSAILSSLPPARVTAVYEKNRFLATTSKAFLPRTIKIYNHLGTMLDKEPLDAVFVTTPIHTHVPIILEVLNSNRHLNLFVEKPLAESHAKAKLACKVLGKGQYVRMVGFQKRFSTVFQKAKAVIENGQLGELVFFRAHAFSSDVLQEGKTWRFRKGLGGALLDLGPHLLDLLSWCFGDPKPLAAVKRRFYSHQVDDYVHAVVSFDSGLKGHLDVCWSIRNFRLPEIGIEVHGKKGMLAATDDFVTVQIKDATPRTWYRQSFETPLPFLLADPEFTREDEIFLSLVDRGGSTDLNFYEAAKINALIDRIDAIAD
jgi:predicted dehydrogenase